MMLKHNSKIMYYNKNYLGLFKFSNKLTKFILILSLWKLPLNKGSFFLYLKIPTFNLNYYFKPRSMSILNLFIKLIFNLALRPRNFMNFVITKVSIYKYIMSCRLNLNNYEKSWGKLFVWRNGNTWVAFKVRLLKWSSGQMQLVVQIGKLE